MREEEEEEEAGERAQRSSSRGSREHVPSNESARIVGPPSESCAKLGRAEFCAAATVSRRRRRRLHQSLKLIKYNRKPLKLSHLLRAYVCEPASQPASGRASGAIKQRPGRRSGAPCVLF